MVNRALLLFLPIVALALGGLIISKPSIQGMAICPDGEQLALVVNKYGATHKSCVPTGNETVATTPIGGIEGQSMWKNNLESRFDKDDRLRAALKKRAEAED